MTTQRIALLILDREATAGERRLADMVVAAGRVVKNKWGGLTVGEMRLTPNQREAVLNALGKS